MALFECVLLCACSCLLLTMISVSSLASGILQVRKRWPAAKQTMPFANSSHTSNVA